MDATFLGPEAGGEKAAARLLAQVLDLGKRLCPGADLSVLIHAGRTANTRFAKGAVTSTGDVSEAEVAVTVAYGQRAARCRTNQSESAALQRAVETASRLARLAPEDPERMPLLPPQRYARVPAAFDGATARLQADARARAVGTLLSAGQAAALELSGYYEHGSTAIVRGNSAGLFAYHQSTEAELSLTARTRDGSGSGWAAAYSNQAAALHAEALAQVAVDKARRAQSPRALAPGRYTVVLEPAAVADLLGFLLSALRARPADEGRSYFSRPGGGNRLGEALFPSRITLRADPQSAATPGVPFDGEGLPLGPQALIEAGVLKALHCDRFWAHKQGRAPQGAPSVAHLHGGTATREGLLQGVKRGVLITRFWYTRMVDPQSLLVTGLTRDGVFLIEDGAVGPPVNNFRFNESPLTMLRNADALSQDVTRQDGDRFVPALRTHEFNLASVSDAV